MRRAMVIFFLSLATLLPTAAPAVAQPGFGLKDLAVSFEEEGGATAERAGSHPYAFTTTIDVNAEGSGAEQFPIDAAKDIEIDLPPGLVANPGAVSTCDAAVFLASAEGKHPKCPNTTVVGLTTVEVGTNEPGPWSAPVYNMTAPRGAVLKFGFIALGVPVTFEAGLRPDPPYNGFVNIANIPQAVNFYGSKTTIWGDPSDESHDPLRGECLDSNGKSKGLCHVSSNGRPFLTLPRSCQGPLTTTFRARSWQDPSTWLTQSVGSGAMSDCTSLSFAPTIDARTSSDRVSSPSGLAFDLDVSDEGLTSAAGRADSDIRSTTVTLPTGVTINPSQAEGLAVCSESELAAEEPDSAFGAGCPAASKIGDAEVETPLLEGQVLQGSLFVAEPYANLAGNSLIALYLVIKDPERGIIVRQPISVSPDPVTGRLISTATEMPQLPFSHFRLHFREGGRSSLITPPGCGTFQTDAAFTPWAAPAASQPASSAFGINHGIDGGACPTGPAPFNPGFSAGTFNNQAGSFSPFALRITRGDGEQDLTKVSSVLPPGVVGKIAGIPYCPNAGIARAASRTGPHGGAEERSDPSCPAASLIGHTLAGAGVGSQLTYVPGSLYLAGPYHGDPLSIVSITPALAGPFDAGTVVVRFALTLDPVTAEVKVDGSASDPIPHILKGIPLNVRDLRAFTDRPGFTLNATSCETGKARATLWGAGTVLAPGLETPVGKSDRYQAAGCQSLGFRPRLTIALDGGTARGDHPALRAEVRPREGDANFSKAVVRLPHSAFLDQAHIHTICTRVQFAAGAGNGAECPAGSVYGRAEARSPLLDEPLSGPVFLRSSSHNLPDLVVALHGLFDIDVAARIDSVHGGIRSTFTGIPDAPFSRFVLSMQGGRKGLIVNSRGLCLKPTRNRADAKLLGQNGKRDALRPIVGASCGKGHRKRHRHQGV